MKSVNSPIRLFSPRREFVLLALPIFFLALAVGEWTLSKSVDDWSRAALMCMANVAFFQGLHIALTFDMALTIPAYRRALSSAWGPMSLIVLTAAGLCLFGLRWAESHSVGHFKILVATLITVYVSLHSLRQSFGISILYNKLARDQGQLSAPQLDILKRGESFERRYVEISFLLVGLGFFIDQLQLSNSQISFLATRTIAVFIFAFMFHLIWMYARIDARLFRLKILFLLRLGLTAMRSLAVFAGVGICAVHGVEYTMMYGRIEGHARDHSREASVWRRGLVAFLAVFVTLAVLFDTNIGLPKIIPGFHLGGWWLDAMITINGSLVLFHIFLDRLMFQMKRPEIRLNTGAWLLSDAAIESEKYSPVNLRSRPT